MGYPPGGQQPPPPGYRQPPYHHHQQQPWTGAPPPPGPRRRSPGPVRIILGVLISLFGLLCTLAGAGVIAQAFSNSNQEIFNQRYAKNLWRNLPVETLFPPAIGMRDPDLRGEKQDGGGGWTRAAVSPETSCGKALAGLLAEEAKKRGCQTVLRATYVDGTGGTAATIAIVVFPADDSGNDLDAILYEAQREKRDYGVRALPAKGVSWTDGARAGSGAASTATLFVAVTSGPADGRRAGKLPQPWGRRESDQRIDRAPWGEIADGLAESATAHLNDQIRKARP
ncbi:hypothetical protein [Nonomuraea longispora]|uniref:hypothetical protein n=1 Tax=Nonomuraea longispora TaxID=1848320 RepID=UPI0014047F96|nr:hypothetical protein [Nonomuraea longispora]